MEKYEVIESTENGEEFINSSLLTNDGHSFIIHRDDIEGRCFFKFLILKHLIEQSYKLHTYDFLLEEILTAENGDGENSNPDGSEDKSEQPLREQDRFLPIANIAKIMKKAIPDSGKVH